MKLFPNDFVDTENEFSEMFDDIDSIMENNGNKFGIFAWEQGDNKSRIEFLKSWVNIYKNRT